MYMAPELLTGVQYGETVDLWSAGAILYEMVTGRKIYSKAKNLEELKDQALRNPKIILPPSANSNIHCRDLLEKLLEKDPSKRITYDDFLAHPFLMPDRPSSPLNQEHRSGHNVECSGESKDKTATLSDTSLRNVSTTDKNSKSLENPEDTLSGCWELLTVGDFESTTSVRTSELCGETKRTEVEVEVEVETEVAPSAEVEAEVAPEADVAPEAEVKVAPSAEVAPMAEALAEDGEIVTKGEEKESYTPSLPFFGRMTAGTPPPPAADIDDKNESSSDQVGAAELNPPLPASIAVSAVSSLPLLVSGEGAGTEGTGAEGTGAKDTGKGTGKGTRKGKTLKISRTNIDQDGATVLFFLVEGANHHFHYVAWHSPGHHSHHYLSMESVNAIRRKQARKAQGGGGEKKEENKEEEEEEENGTSTLPRYFIGTIIMCESRAASPTQNPYQLEEGTPFTSMTAVPVDIDALLLQDEFDQDATMSSEMSSNGISFLSFQEGDIVLALPAPRSQHYQYVAFHEMKGISYPISKESIAAFERIQLKNGGDRTVFLVGRIVMMEMMESSSDKRSCQLTLSPVTDEK